MTWTEERRTGKALFRGDYARLWTAASVSALGDGVSLTAAPILAASLTSDPLAIAGVTVALTVPFALFGLPAGLLVDSVDRRKVMVVIDIIRGVCLLSLSLLVVEGSANLPALYATFFLVGTGETVYRNASQAITSELVAEEALVAANSRISSSQTAGGQFVGPVLGAALFAVNRALPFAADGASFLASGSILLTLRRRPSTRSPEGSRTPVGDGLWAGRLLRDMTWGARWLFRHPVLRSLALIAGALNVFNGATMAILIVYSHRILHLGNFGYSVLVCAEAVGAVFGGVFAPIAVRRLGRERGLVAVAAVLTVGFATLAVARLPLIAGFGLACGGFSAVMWDGIVVALRQTLVPHNLQGRVNSAYRLIAWGSLPVGSLAGGIVAHLWGPPWVFLTATAGMLGIDAALVARARHGWIGHAMVKTVKV